MALVAVLAGCQAIHVTSYDEAYTIPSEEAQRTALRTQQIIFYETDVAAVADPMGGSYFLEYLTNKIEEEVQGVMAQIEERGGILKGIEDGSIQREITRGAYESEKKIQNGEKVIVGVNKFVSEEKEYPIQIYPTDKSVWKKQISRLKEVKAKRNQRLVDLALGEIRRVAAGKSNLMVPIFSAVCEYATVGEICNALKEVFGEYKEIV